MAGGQIHKADKVGVALEILYALVVVPAFLCMLAAYGLLLDVAIQVIFYGR